MSLSSMAIIKPIPLASTAGVPGFIYILKPGLTIGGSDVIKIGMTTRTVAQRVRELKTGSAVPLEIVYSLKVENARAVEKDLHFRFRSRRIVGGGQEFFAVPAREAITEIECMAERVSVERAQQANTKEIRAYMAHIGAAKVESQINSCFTVIGLVGYVSIILSGLGISHRFYGGGYDALVFLAAFFVLPAALIMLGLPLKRHAMNKLYEPRFGTAIERKRDELRLKYPLAYRWERNLRPNVDTTG